MARKARSPLGPLALAVAAILVVTLALWQTVVAGGTNADRQATSYTVEAGDSLSGIAKKVGVNVNDLAAANGLAPNAILYRKQVLTIPRGTASGAAAQAAAETPVPQEEVASSESGAADSGDMSAAASATPSTYKVEAGESLSLIAKKLHVDVHDLAAVNGLQPNSILYRGLILTVPGPGVEAPVVAVQVPSAAPMAAATAKPTTYKVEAGESLSLIAKKLRVDVHELAAVNGLQPNSILYRGLILTVPGAGTPAAAAEEATPEAVAEVTAAPTEEPAEEAAAVPTAEPTEEATPEAVAEATEVPAEEPTEEALEEATVEATEEPVEEATAEGTPAAVEEAAPEATPTPAEESPAAEATVEVDIIEVATAAGEFNALLSALDLAGLTDALRQEGPFTVFAPNDAAFAALPEDTLNALLADPAGDLSQILLFHVVPGRIMAADLSEGLTATTLQGSELTFSVADGPKVEGINIIGTDFIAANGVIHVIDQVLSPPISVSDEGATDVPADEAATEAPAEEPAPEDAADAETGDAAGEGDILATAAAAGDFTTLLAAIDAAGLTDALKSVGPLTVFAPTDEAFAALPAGQLDELLADPAGDLTQILLYHVVPGKVMAEDLSDGQIAITLQGGELTFSVADDTATVNGVNLVITNIETTNGVIHVIDAVLIPPDLATAPDDLAQIPADQSPAATTTLTEEMTVADAAVIVIAAPTGDAADTAAVWQDQVNDGVRVITPVGGAYHSPLTVSGLARAATGMVQVSLVADDDMILGQRTLAVGRAPEGMDDPGVYGFFHGNLRFYVNNITEATLRVVEMDMGDGTVLSEENVPVTLLSGQRLIDVSAPVVGQAVCGDIVVSGYSNTFEANVVVSLFSPDGALQAQIPAMGGGLGIYRDFATTLTYPVDTATPLIVGASETDASGRFDSIDRTHVPVALYPADAPECAQE